MKTFMDGRWLAVVIAGGLVACSGAGMTNARLDSATGDPTGDSGPDTDDSGELLADAAWFALDGEVELIDGSASVATINIRFLADEVGEGTLCTDAFEVLAMQPRDVPDPLVFHWWDVVIDPSSGACAGAERLPSSLRFGLGELYPQVVAGVDQHGLGDVKDSLYGSYASFDAPVGDGVDQTTYAYGYAGTEGDRLGETVAVEAGPMPDGLYLVTAFYLFELLPEE